MVWFAVIKPWPESATLYFPQAIIIFTAVQYQPLEIFGKVYPDSALALGWCVVAAPLICIPAWFIGKLLHDGGWDVSAGII
jgi:hypothetical protein